MNGARLPPHHGASVRLVVTGKYGCASIKSVNRIDLVPDELAADAVDARVRGAHASTRGVTLAREFAPAAIDVATCPIRVEQWSIAGRPLYRVWGIVWGGSVPTSALQMRFQTGDLWVNVADCPRPATTSTEPVVA